jgi:hypothetical protein
MGHRRARTSARHEAVHFELRATARHLQGDARGLQNPNVPHTFGFLLIYVKLLQFLVL